MSLILLTGILLFFSSESKEDAVCKFVSLSSYCTQNVDTCQIFFSVFQHMSTTHQEFSHGEQVNLATVAEIFVEWTDPQKAV
jgi:hypothetical protein